MAISLIIEEKGLKMRKNKIAPYTPEQKSDTHWRHKVNADNAPPTYTRGALSRKAYDDGTRIYRSSYASTPIRGHLERQSSIIDRKRRRSGVGETSPFVQDFLGSVVIF